MQDGKTPLEAAVDRGHHKTVEYFIKDCSVDTSQFDVVCNIYSMFCVCVQ